MKLYERQRYIAHLRDLACRLSEVHGTNGTDQSDLDMLLSLARKLEAKED